MTEERRTSSSLPPSLPPPISLLGRDFETGSPPLRDLRRVSQVPPGRAGQGRAGMRKGIPLPLPPSLFCACARRATIPFLSHFHPIFATVGFCNAAAAVAWHKVGDFPLAVALALLRLGLRWYQTSIAFVSSQGD